jgi:hypothetical protein
LVDSTGILVPVVVAIFSAVTAPLFLMWWMNRQRRKDKEQDYAREDKIREEDRERQDAIADQAAEAASLLLDSNARVAAAAAVANARQAERGKELHHKLTKVGDTVDVVHTLVNSDKTAAMQAQLDSTERELVMMRENAELHKLLGRDPSAEALAAIKAAQVKIEELRAELTARHEQAAIAEQQMEAHSEA